MPRPDADVIFARSIYEIEPGAITSTPQPSCELKTVIGEKVDNDVLTLKEPLVERPDMNRTTPNYRDEEDCCDSCCGSCCSGGNGGDDDCCIMCCMIWCIFCSND